MRIVQAANFMTPTSGGLRTALRELGRGYAAAGHERILIVPGPVDARVDTELGPRYSVRAPVVPGTGGYRMIVEPWRVLRLLDELAPDRLEVSDRLTLRRLGAWATRHDVPSVVVSHERSDRLLEQLTGARVPTRAIADRANRRLAESFDAVVCTTGWAAEEFALAGARNVCTVPLGVDLAEFHPSRFDRWMRRCLSPAGEIVLLHTGRLSPEKRPDLALATLVELLRRGMPARLVIAGDGPLRRRLERAAAGLPVRFLGFVAARDRLAEILAVADVLLAPGPVETFCLSALEALASGTPVVASGRSALTEILVPGAGVAAGDTADAFADAVAGLVAVDEGQRRAAARRRAMQFPWSATIDGFFRVHQLIGNPPLRRAG